jgi:AhpD family alkylhydroperoxidase
METTMKTAFLSLSLVLFAAAGAPAVAHADKADDTVKEIEKTFGFVPGFVKVMPRAALPSWWEQTKALEMNPETALDGKTKELIGLAVAAQIPCEYCVYFHTEAARLNGASQQEIDEAVGMAAATRAGSTLLNGLQVDKSQFKKDVDRIVKGAKKAAQKQAKK